MSQTAQSAAGSDHHPPGRATRHRRGAAVFAALAALAGVATAQTVPTGFAIDTLLSTGLQLPHDCCFLPDGRCLVANAAGQVVLYAGSGPVAIGTVPNVETGGERGLLSIAADPAFASNGHFYVYYSSTVDQFLHLDRFTCTGDLAQPTSTNLAFAAATRHVVLADLRDTYNNHNGGSVRFGPDGMLYLSVGDDLNECGAQSVTTGVGCLLRLDVSALPAGGNGVAPPYAALDPGDNPMSGQTDIRQLVLAHGLRNPFRLEIDPVTGNLYLGDVGLSSVEELSEYVRPAASLPLVNFGWPWREGNQVGAGCGGTAPAGLVAPIAAVAHGTGWASIMAGARYRNLGGMNDFGAAYEGSVFYADYFAGEVRRLVEVGGVWTPAPPVPGQPSATNWATGFDLVTSLRLGPDGALWFTQRSGTLKRLRPRGQPNSLVAIGGDLQLAAAGDAFAAPLAVRLFDAQGNPRSNAAVTFTLAGAGTLAASGPVATDADGVATTTCQARTAGGAIAVTASAVGQSEAARFRLFARKLSVSHTGNRLEVVVRNASPAKPPQVPFVLLVSFPGAPILPTPFGPVCTDPASPLTLVLEDSLGLFGGGSFSGTGMVGTPSATKVYVGLPLHLLAGQSLDFQAIGIDPVLGWFRTNCEPHRF